VCAKGLKNRHLFGPAAPMIPEAQTVFCLTRLGRRQNGDFSKAVCTWPGMGSCSKQLILGKQKKVQMPGKCDHPGQKGTDLRLVQFYSQLAVEKLNILTRDLEFYEERKRFNCA
jgi:hypothetical protein